MTSLNISVFLWCGLVVFILELAIRIRYIRLQKSEWPSCVHMHWRLSVSVCALQRLISATPFMGPMCFQLYLYLYKKEFVSFCICVAVINTLSGGSKKLSETQLTSRGNKIDQRKQGIIGSREEIGSQSKQLDVDNNIQTKITTS